MRLARNKKVLLYGAIRLKTSLGEVYVDDARYPDMDFRERDSNQVALDGKEEILIPCGTLEFTISDCTGQVVKTHTLDYELPNHAQELATFDRSLVVKLTQFEDGNFLIREIFLSSPMGKWRADMERKQARFEQARREEQSARLQQKIRKRESTTSSRRQGHPRASPPMRQQSLGIVNNKTPEADSPPNNGKASDRERGRGVTTPAHNPLEPHPLHRVIHDLQAPFRTVAIAPPKLVCAQPMVQYAQSALAMQRLSTSPTKSMEKSGRLEFLPKLELEHYEFVREEGGGLWTKQAVLAPTFTHATAPTVQHLSKKIPQVRQLPALYQSAKPQTARQHTSSRQRTSEEWQVSSAPFLTPRPTHTASALSDKVTTALLHASDAISS